MDEYLNMNFHYILNIIILNHQEISGIEHFLIYKLLNEY